MRHNTSERNAYALKDRLVRSTSAAATALVCALLVAGCGKHISADKATLGHCTDAPFNQEGTAPVGNTTQLMTQARADILTLQQRVLADGGSIDLSNDKYLNAAHEIEATSTELVLHWPYSSIGSDTNSVTFLVKDDTPSFELGAIACTDNVGALYPNSTFASLEHYADESGGIPPIK